LGRFANYSVVVCSLSSRVYRRIFKVILYCVLSFWASYHIRSTPQFYRNLP